MSKICKNPKLQEHDKRLLMRSLLGLLMASLSLLYGIYVKDLMNRLLQGYLILRPDSRIFEVWQTPPLNPTLNFYLFNWTNADQFHNPDVKPILEEVGPYRFKESVKKQFVQWHPHNYSISYRMQKFFYFDEETSNGRLNDTITTFNFIAFGAAAKARNVNFMQRTLIEMGLQVTNNDVSITRTPNELIFQGYSDGLLSIGNMLPSSLSGMETVQVDKIGYGYGQNGTYHYSPLINMFTGADDYRKAGKIHTVSYYNTTGLKFPTECNEVRGTSGDLYSQHLVKNENIEVFIPEFCRAVEMLYNETTMVNGKVAYDYKPGLKFVDNGTLYPENKCFCNGECLRSGVANISSCWYNAPLFVSYPHFLMADPWYSEQVVGMRPEKDKHEFFIRLEPQTGLMFDLHARIQGNVYLHPISHSKLFRKSRSMMFPLFWFDFEAHITPEYLNEFSLFEKAIRVNHAVAAICVLIGLLICFYRPVKYYFKKRCSNNLQITDMNQDEYTPCATEKSANPIQASSPLLDSERILNKLQYSKSVDSGNISQETISSSQEAV